MRKILVVEDERDIAEMVAYSLKREGFAVKIVGDGDLALSSTLDYKPSMVLLDLMLPGIDGQEVCRQLKRNPLTEKIPVIMITAKTDVVDKIVGLEIGADDYITKPFDIRELIARVRTVFRRFDLTLTQSGEVFASAGLLLDYRNCELMVDGSEVEISATEYKLLSLLTKNPGRVFSREQILDHIWRDEAFVEPRTVDVHIGRLRAKIERDRRNPQYIITVSGLGYKFVKTE
ncbi:MAG: response regulator transcription factor [Deltaproteobacteria bacterium]|nr:response regulator transcription factor [Deltaproteobacteria bacterium]